MTLTIYCRPACDAIDPNTLTTSIDMARVWKARGSVVTPDPDDMGQPLGAEFLSKRLARVANLVGVTMPGVTHEQIAEVAGTILGEIARRLEAPIPMILHCPRCTMQHVDEPETHEMVIADVPGWTNPPHRSHLCHGCGHIWRPADVPTEGVKAIQTRGKADSPECGTCNDNGIVGANQDQCIVGMLAELHRMGATPAGLSLAAQLFGAGPCAVCGFRKLYCRCPAEATTPRCVRCNGIEFSLAGHGRPPACLTCETPK